jgi:chorismate mutase
MQRTVKDLIDGIAEKFQIDPTRITQVTHINSRGLQIVVDEDVVRELPEGQDMIVEFSSTNNSDPAKNELTHLGSAGVIANNELGIFDMTVSDPLEMWLNY